MISDDSVWMFGLENVENQDAGLAWCRDRLDGWTDWLYPVWSPLTKGRCTQTHLKVGFSSGSGPTVLVREQLYQLLVAESI